MSHPWFVQAVNACEMNKLRTNDMAIVIYVISPNRCSLPQVFQCPLSESLLTHKNTPKSNVGLAEHHVVNIVRSCMWKGTFMRVRDAHCSLVQ
jgi:hypothetical protein